ncbi:flagellar basal body rod protein FlgB [Oryzifoliimicrobium ureilyticus]|uniref:flagellar basal body rod protein FlgB n=1 Tax=Oryzifoliimicrobium ureilyticus TaxID=3113724 RepID=UPI0030767830
MQPIQLFDLASRQAEWLTIRQQVVSGNIANANTPKYHAKDVTPFDAVLDHSDFSMARTNPAHLSGNDISQKSDINIRDSALDQEIGVQQSGNTVSLADELSKSGEIKRQYDLNTSLVGSFNRMILMAVKS